MSDRVVVVHPAEAKCRRDEAEAAGYTACRTDISADRSSVPGHLTTDHGFEG